MARFWEYITAVLGYWQFWVAVAFMSERSLERFCPRVSAHLDGILPPTRRRTIFIWIAIIAFLYANFRAFDDERSAKETAIAATHTALLTRATLSPPQTRLLNLIQKYQNQFATTKLIIGRDGHLHFDGDTPQGNNINLVDELFGGSSQNKSKEFGDIVDSIPPEYLRSFPEMRLGSPFVVGITDAGVSYLATHP